MANDKAEAHIAVVEEDTYRVINQLFQCACPGRTTVVVLHV
jgi:hypothetical protein